MASQLLITPEKFQGLYYSNVIRPSPACQEGVAHETTNILATKYDAQYGLQFISGNTIEYMGTALH